MMADDNDYYTAGDRYWVNRNDVSDLVDRLYLLRKAKNMSIADVEAEVTTEMKSLKVKRFENRYVGKNSTRHVNDIDDVIAYAAALGARIEYVVHEYPDFVSVTESHQRNREAIEARVEKEKSVSELSEGEKGRLAWRFAMAPNYFGDVFRILSVDGDKVKVVFQDGTTENVSADGVYLIPEVDSTVNWTDVHVPEV